MLHLRGGSGKQQLQGWAAPGTLDVEDTIVVARRQFELRISAKSGIVGSVGKLEDGTVWRALASSSVVSRFAH